MSSASLSEQIAAMRSARSCPRLSSRLQSRSSLPPPYHGQPWIRRSAIQALGLDQLTYGVGNEMADRAAGGDAPADHRGRDVDLRHLDALDVGIGEHVGRDARAPRDGDLRQPGHELGPVPGRERRELVGARAAGRGRSRDSAARARAACPPCTTGRAARSRRARPSAPGCRSPRPARGAGAWPRLLGRRPVRRRPGRHEHDPREAELPGRLLAEQQVPEVNGVAERAEARRRAVSPMLTTRVVAVLGEVAVRDCFLGRQRELEALVADRDLVSGLDARAAQRLDHAEAAELDRERAHAPGVARSSRSTSEHDLAARDAHEAVVAHEAEQALPRARGR